MLIYSILLSKHLFHLPTYRSSGERHLDLIEILNRAPTLADEALLSDVDVEHIEGVVDGLDLPHFCEPVLVGVVRRG